MQTYEKNRGENTKIKFAKTEMLAVGKVVDQILAKCMYISELLTKEKAEKGELLVNRKSFTCNGYFKYD